MTDVRPRLKEWLSPSVLIHLGAVVLVVAGNYAVISDRLDGVTRKMNEVSLKLDEVQRAQSEQSTKLAEQAANYRHLESRINGLEADGKVQTIYNQTLLARVAKLED